LIRQKPAATSRVHVPARQICFAQLCAAPQLPFSFLGWHPSQQASVVEHAQLGVGPPSAAAFPAFPAIAAPAFPAPPPAAGVPLSPAAALCMPALPLCAAPPSVLGLSGCDTDCGSGADEAASRLIWSLEFASPVERGSTRQMPS
jgi:hypothetical protein